MKRYILPIIALLIAAGLQSNWPSSWDLLGAKPDFVLVMLIVFSLENEPNYGVGLGFCAGLIMGASVGSSIGSFLVSRILTGFGAGLTNKRLFSKNPIVIILSTVALTIICEVIFLMANPRPFMYIVRIITGEAVYNGIAAWLINIIMTQAEQNKKDRLFNARARF